MMRANEFKLIVAPEAAGQTAASVLRKQAKVSTRLIKQLKRQGSLQCNGKPILLKQIVQAGDCLTFCTNIPVAELTAVPGAPFRYLDDNYCIVQKPAELVVHPTIGHSEKALTSMLADQSLHPVSRLDRNTSGLVLIARHGYAHHLLSQTKIRKLYLAVVWGRVANTDWQEIDAPIGRSDFSYMTRIVHPLGKVARTRYRRISYDKELNQSLVELELLTGRTHQIRVHMLWLGHPLVGDYLYGYQFLNKAEQRPKPRFMRLDWDRDYSEYPCSRVMPKKQEQAECLYQKIIEQSATGQAIVNRVADGSEEAEQRHLLHCYQLQFQDPFTGEERIITTPYPLDFPKSLLQIPYDKDAYLPATSLYVHVPYCNCKCHYCGFVSQMPQADSFATYCEVLLKELEQRYLLYQKQCSEQGITEIPKLETVYFGGGTPSVLPAKMLRKILQRIDELFGIAENAEITLEINPATLSEKEARELFSAGDLGFNRASLGYQACQDEMLASLGRIHRHSDALRTIQYLKHAGCNNISCDLMIGLPGQTLAQVRESLEDLLSLEVQHISFYALSLEPGTVFAKRYEANELHLPTEEAEREMYHYIIKRAEESGFVLYEISNLAKHGYMSRHNSVYWQQLPYLAVGPAASRLIFQERSTNNYNIRAWIEDPLSLQESYSLESADSASEYMWLGLRRCAGIDCQAFTNRFGISPLLYYHSEIQELVQRDLLIQDGNNLRLSKPDGLDLANQVFAAFV